MGFADFDCDSAFETCFRLFRKPHQNAKRIQDRQILRADLRFSFCFQKLTSFSLIFQPTVTKKILYNADQTNRKVEL